MTIRIHAVVHGYVQGVGFRYAAARAASRAGVTGFVHNTPTGDVVIEAEGDQAAVDRMLVFLRTGPPAAEVTSVDVRQIAPRGDSGFGIG